MRTRNQDRRGVTLLFVVSMIVLFLLMGTTFVVLANDYFRTASKRIKLHNKTVDHTAYLHRSMFNLVRGPELEDTNSSMRGFDLLSDMYGYGYKATVKSAQSLGVNSTAGGRVNRRAMIRIVLNETSTIYPVANTTGALAPVRTLGLRDLLADARARSKGFADPKDLLGGVLDSATSTNIVDPLGPDVSTPDTRYEPGNANHIYDYFPEMDVPNYFGGQILSFVDGPAKGVSARIVDYTVTIDPSDNIIRSFVIVPERLPSGANSPFDSEAEIAYLGEVWTGGLLDNVPSTIVINGKPFSGYGAGARLAGSNLIVDAQSAFRPNTARYQDPVASPADGLYWRDTDANGTVEPVGDPFFDRYSLFRNSLNEPYDAFDHDNLFLAQSFLRFHPNFDAAGNIIGGGFVDQVTQASFNPVQLAGKHTPANRSGPGAVIPENSFSFRPVLQLDPNDPTQYLPSSTANVNFPNIGYFTSDATTTWAPHQPQSRPLDVDNDGDGKPDSVWVDMGHPIHISPEGKKYKPLVASMIVELDSRNNLNAHGTIADAQARFDDGNNGSNGGYMVANDAVTNIPAPNPLLWPNVTGNIWRMMGTTPATVEDRSDMPRGLGWGPAEISLAALMPDYRPLLVGTPTPSGATPLNTTFPNYLGRYGVDRLPGAVQMDLAAVWRFLDHPTPATHSQGVLGRNFVGRPMDLHGRFANGFPATYEQHEDPNNPGTFIDVPYGFPITDLQSSLWPAIGPRSNAAPYSHPGAGWEIFNSPYEVSLNAGTQTSDPNFNVPNDALFTPDELEGVLRQFDIDSALLHRRLADLGLPSESRYQVTTESWEVPALPAENISIVQRMYEVLKFNGLSHNEAFAAMRGTSTVHSLLSYETMHGLPMNINRIFGDGADNDGDGIFDEHWDSSDERLNERSPGPDGMYGNGDDYFSENHPSTLVAMDHDNNGVNNIQDRFPRQILARHLFILTWLVTGEPTSGTNLTPEIADFNDDGSNDEEDIALLAQWCINVIDFRDGDSICTPFEYDVNPWDGWDVDNRVMNSEPPAYDTSHAFRRLVWGVERPELLLTEAFATHERRYEDTDSDGQFESVLVPKASVFVELFNPWAGNVNSQQLPAELYSGGGVNLAGTNRALSSEVDPIWRMVFTEQRDSDANDADSRRVYFRDPGADVEPNTDGNFYHTTAAVDVIRPNGYAVIGSAGVQDSAGDYRTTFGRRTDLGARPPADLRLDDTRSITLKPGVGVTMNTFDTTANAMTQIDRPCVAIPIDVKNRDVDQEPRSLGISDPTEGYATLAHPISEIDPDSDSNPDDGDGFRYNIPLANGTIADNLPGKTYPQMRSAGGTGDPTPGDAADYPGTNSAVFTDGVTVAARYVQLQRLANPEAPYHEKLNPYLTIDTKPVDLMSFNGIDRFTGANADADIRNQPGYQSGGRMAFDSLERGEQEAATDRFLWPEEAGRTTLTENLLATDQHFLNSNFVESFGIMNAQYRQNSSVQNVPFPWFTWNNRPYVSEYELTNVPMFRSDLLLQNFTTPNQATLDPDQIMPDHVVQFNDKVLKKIFGYIEVLPRFINSEIGFAADQFDQETINASTYPSAFNAPYNYISRYRYPGKLNINTMSTLQAGIWNVGVMGAARNTPNTVPWGVDFIKLAEVRGDSGTVSIHSSGDNYFTTSIDNTPDAANYYGYSGSYTDEDIFTFTTPSFVSLDPIRPDGVADFDPPRAIPDPQELSTGESDGTILRSTDGSNDHLLRSSTNAYDNTDRNGWFANSTVTKLANVSTNRSSVFAIWITVGYFEIDEAGRVGAEIGSDTGEATRNRAFYIYDRSIPVAYEPGFNHNVERGILVSTIIE